MVERPARTLEVTVSIPDWVILKNFKSCSNNCPSMVLRIVVLAYGLTRWCQDKWTSREGNVEIYYWKLVENSITHHTNIQTSDATWVRKYGHNEKEKKHKCYIFLGILKCCSKQEMVKRFVQTLEDGTKRCKDSTKKVNYMYLNYLTSFLKYFMI